MSTRESIAATLQAPLPIVCVEGDGVLAPYSGHLRVRCSLKADPDWYASRAAELLEQLEYLTGEYMATLAIERWARKAIDDEITAIAHEYYGPDLSSMTEGAWEIVRELHRTRKKVAELTRPRSR
ncbi:hypothetical protein [Arthrobacter sp. IK3]|uniref:hypothetical protein n=1 Tax=Arthrobacter sp. IK3 TaxID=3448169 RepID=UPI003EE37573